MKPLVFSMGFNGYQWAWRRAVATHRAYAERNNYDYVMVQRPTFTPLMMECTWLKLPLITAALEAGRPWVFYVDSDVEVKPECPPADTVFVPGGSLYMAHGYSGRFNAGVILARRAPEAIALLRKMVDTALMPLPPEDDVGWGDNGHVIHHAKSFAGSVILGPEWNNNHLPELVDFVRHYSGGPMRPHYRFTAAERAAMKLGKLYAKLRPGTNGFSHERLAHLVRATLRKYPEFAKTPARMPASPDQSPRKEEVSPVRA